MERLTNSGKEIPTLVDNAEYWLQVYFKLKEYEQAEEDGLLHKAPIPNGTIIYLWAENDDDEMIIHRESYLYGVTEFLYGKFGEDFWDSEEQALSKMKGV